MRSIAHGAAVTVSSAITADARVAASFDAYLGLARNVTSPGPASSMLATRVDLDGAVAFEPAAEFAGRDQRASRRGEYNIRDR